LKAGNACTVANAKHKHVVKVSYNANIKMVGERMFLDLSSIKPPKKGGVVPKPQWRMLVDEAVKLKISHLFAKKNEMV
jgi:hypothetical protein